MEKCRFNQLEKRESQNSHPPHVDNQCSGRQIHPSRRLPVCDVAVGDRARHGFEQVAEPESLRRAGRSAAESAASTQGRRLGITASR
jgi:hypothetical protein